MHWGVSDLEEAMVTYRVYNILLSCLLLMVGSALKLWGQTELLADSAVMLVASQVRSQLIFIEGEFDISDSVMRAVPINEDTGVLSVWRVVLPWPHAGQYYLVGHSTEGMIRLGGFPSPNLFAAARALRPATPASPGQLLGNARQLAVLGDTQGADDIVFPFGPDSLMPAAMRWRTVGMGRGADTVVTRNDHQYVAQVTILTHRFCEIPTSWLGSAYSFVYDASGNLMAWSKYPSKPFGLGVDTD